MIIIQEQQKPAKRKYTKKQRPPAPVAPPPPVQTEPAPASPPPAPESADFSPDRRMEYYSASLLDHEYTAGPGPFGPGGPRGSGAMAPGVFLTSRRPSLSPQNSSTYSPSGASPAGLASQGTPGAGQGKHRPTVHCTWLQTYVTAHFLIYFPLSFYQGNVQRKDWQLQNRDLEKF